MLDIQEPIITREQRISARVVTDVARDAVNKTITAIPSLWLGQAKKRSTHQKKTEAGNNIIAALYRVGWLDRPITSFSQADWGGVLGYIEFNNGYAARNQALTFLDAMYENVLGIENVAKRIHYIGKHKPRNGR